MAQLHHYVNGIAHRSEDSARRPVLAAVVPSPPREGGNHGHKQQELLRHDTLEPDELAQAPAEDKALGRQASRPGLIPRALATPPDAHTIR
jgi:hypothetical protein